VGGRFFLFVGALEPRKNITFLLDVFRKHVASHPNDRLVLCGPPGWNNAEILQAIESFQPADRLVRLSYVSDAELRWLYRNASCLLMPSLYEGFGLPPLEAAALGTPSLVSDGGSLPEVVATPEQVIPLDVEKWVKALTSLPAISSEQLKAFAAGFSWDCAATELLDLIETKLI
jgi:glycosyltransferase involved in cell wall biosynthesis